MPNGCAQRPANASPETQGDGLAPAVSGGFRDIRNRFSEDTIAGFDALIFCVIFQQHSAAAQPAVDGSGFMEGHSRLGTLVCFIHLKAFLRLKKRHFGSGRFLTNGSTWDL
jgi:hypothetical protein